MATSDTPRGSMREESAPIESSVMNKQAATTRIQVNLPVGFMYDLFICSIYFGINFTPHYTTFHISLQKPGHGIPKLLSIDAVQSRRLQLWILHPRPSMERAPGVTNQSCSCQIQCGLALRLQRDTGNP